MVSLVAVGDQLSSSGAQLICSSLAELEDGGRVVVARTGRADLLESRWESKTSSRHMRASSYSYNLA